MSVKVYVGNVSYTATEESLRSVFEPYGSVDNVNIIRDLDTGQPRGFAFVTMPSAEDARRAISELHLTKLDGRTLCVDQADREKRGGGRSS